MLSRPFAPFRSRPLRPAAVRRPVDSSIIAELAAEATTSIGEKRRPARLITPSAHRLRVLKDQRDVD